MTVTLVQVPVKVCQASWRLGAPASAAATVSAIIAKIIKAFEIFLPPFGLTPCCHDLKESPTVTFKSSAWGDRMTQGRQATEQG
jgi:hypothetical protein